MPAHPCDGALCEEVGVVFNPTDQSSGVVTYLQSKIEFRSCTDGWWASDSEILEDKWFPGSVLQNEHHREQGRMTNVASRIQLFNQSFEGELLMHIGAQRGLLNTFKSFAKS